MKTRIFTIFLLAAANFANAQISFDPLPPAPPAPQLTGDFLKTIRGSVAFADVNGDGYPDVLITGDVDQETAAMPATALYLNDGSGNFMQVAGAPFIESYYGSVNFADIDGDNDPDVLITGYRAATSSALQAKLYKNDGDGNFTLFADESVLQPVGDGDADFADIDGDGDLDLLIAGMNNSKGSTRLYANDGSGNFTLIDNTPFAQVWGGTVDFEDVDGDKDLDVLITGAYRVSANQSATTTELYINDGSGNFTLAGDTPFFKVRRSTVNFADFDGDNDPDVLITGDSTYSGNSGQTAQLYLNNGSGKFSLATGTTFTNIEQGAVEVSDIDNDGDKDILLTGYTGYGSSGNVAELYINNGAAVFTLAGGSPFPKIRNGGISFADVDADGDDDVLLTGSQGSSSGGNVGNLFVNDGTGKFTKVARSQFIEVGYKNFYYGTAAFSDVDNDGDQDVMISGRSDSLYYNTELYFNNGQGHFTMVDNTTFAVLSSAALGFADVDNDGDQDVLMAGYGKFPGGTFKRLAALYKFDSGTSKYVMADNTTFTAVMEGVVRFADVDNDGDQDVLIMGSSSTNIYSTKLYLNDGSGNFSPSGVTFTDMSLGDAAFADVNGDGYADLFLVGNNAGRKAELYVNDKAGGFSLFDDQTFEKVRNGAIAFADVDGDGDQDLFISGDGEGSYNSVGNLYINDGKGNFALQSGSSIKGVQFSAIAFTDVDADGDPDLIITGTFIAATHTAGIDILELYVNDGSGNFSLLSDSPFWGFQGVKRGRIAIADIDNNDKEDVLFVGWSQSGRAAKLFKNNSCIAATSTDVVTACDSIVWIDGNTYYESTDTPVYVFSGGASNGCDSIVTLNLTINKSVTSTDIRNACDSIVWIDGNTYYESTNAPTYVISGGASSGCDSIVTLNLTVVKVDASITIDGMKITASESNATYQWLDCDNGLAPIDGENGQDFTAAEPGSYAVEISKDGCVKISVCESLAITALDESQLFREVTVYPNPANNIINIYLGDLKEVNMSVYNAATGRVVYQNEGVNMSLFNMKLNVNPGVYILELEAQGDRQKYKLVIQ